MDQRGWKGQLESIAWESLGNKQWPLSFKGGVGVTGRKLEMQKGVRKACLGQATTGNRRGHR